MPCVEEPFFCMYVPGVFLEQAYKSKLHPCQLCRHRQYCKNDAPLDSPEFNGRPNGENFVNLSGRWHFCLDKLPTCPVEKPRIAIMCKSCLEDSYAEHVIEFKDGEIAYIFKCERCDRKFALRQFNFVYNYVGCWNKQTGRYIEPKLFDKISTGKKRKYIAKLIEFGYAPPSAMEKYARKK